MTGNENDGGIGALLIMCSFKGNTGKTADRVKSSLTFTQRR